MLCEYSALWNIKLIPDFFDCGSKLLNQVKKYDIIFMDYIMDGVDGIETVRKIRENNKDVVVIFVSAYIKHHL